MCVGNFLASVDWDATGTMLQGLGTVGGAVAVYVASKLGLSAWKDQKLAERNRDQAEVILHAAYSARRALANLRSPLMYGAEQAAAQEKLDAANPNWQAGIIEEKKKRTITAQAYYNRANRFLDERSKLNDCLPMARALFGEELEKSIDSLQHQFHVVLTYAEAYIDDYNGNDRDFTVKIGRALFSGSERIEGEINEVSDSIENSINVVERVCLPYLRLESR